MPTHLFKTEPGAYSYADLAREKHAAWEGVTNNAALIHLRNCRKGDEVYIYHTADEKAIVGLARVLGSPYEDPANPGQTPSGEPRFALVDLAPVRAAKTPLTLASIKADRRFARFALVTHSRLSVMPVPPEIDALVRTMTGL